MLLDVHITEDLSWTISTSLAQTLEGVWSSLSSSITTRSSGCQKKPSTS